MRRERHRQNGLETALQWNGATEREERTVLAPPLGLEAPPVALHAEGVADLLLLPHAIWSRPGRVELRSPIAADFGIGFRKIAPQLRALQAKHLIAIANDQDGTRFIAIVSLSRP